MFFTLAYAFLALASVAVVFFVGYRLSGLRLALLASGVAVAGLFSFFVVMLIFLTSQM